MNNNQNMLDEKHSNYNRISCNLKAQRVLKRILSFSGFFLLDLDRQW